MPDGLPLGVFDTPSLKRRGILEVVSTEAKAFLRDDF